MEDIIVGLVQFLVLQFILKICFFGYKNVNKIQVSYSGWFYSVFCFQKVNLLLEKCKNYCNRELE